MTAASLGTRPHRDEEDRAHGDHVPAHDLGEGDEADVLAVRRIRQPAEQCYHRGAESVRHDAALQLPVGRLSVGAAHRNARDVAHGLDSGNESHDDHQTDEADRGSGCELEPEPCVGQSDPRRLCDRGRHLPVHHAEGNGEQITDHQPDEDRGARPHTAAVAADEQSDDDYEQGHRPVRGAPEACLLAEGIGVGTAPRSVLDAPPATG